MSNPNTKLEKIVDSLTEHFGRFPTEDEVMTFIFGSVEEKNAIWNIGINRQKEKEDA